MNNSTSNVRTPFILSIIFFCICFSSIILFPSTASAETNDVSSEPKWTVYFRPGVRFGTDNRTLYIMDFLVPLYQDDRNVFFASPKFTPNDQDGWEANLGLGYRRLLFDDRLIFGVNGFYDQRKISWGSIYEQWGVGAEVMADIPIGKADLGITGRFNYYHPLTSAKIYIGPNGGYVYRGNDTYTFDDAWIKEPLGGVDGEVGIRVPYVSDYVETWVYGGAYHFEGKYFDDVDGISARLEVIPTDFLKLNYEYRQDRTNSDKGGDHYGEVMVEIPFSIDNLVSGKNPFEGLGKRTGRSREFKERLTEPVRRDVDIFEMDSEKEDDPTFTSNALGNNYVIINIVYEDPGNTSIHFEAMPDKVVYVSETGSDETGYGTAASPYKSIGRAALDSRIVSGDIRTIYVLNSSDSVEDYVEGGGINAPNLLVLGSGFVLDYQIYTDLEIIAQHINMNNLPTVGSAVDIGNSYITVMGLLFYNHQNSIDRLYGLRVNGNNIEGIRVAKNTFTIGNTIGKAFGIDSPTIPYNIGSPANPLLIWGNTFSISSPVYAAAIYYNTGSTEFYTTIMGNTINASSAASAYGIFFDCDNTNVPTNTDLNVNITGNFIDVSGFAGEASGVLFEENGLNITHPFNVDAKISGNNIVVNGANTYGVNFNSDNWFQTGSGDTKPVFNISSEISDNTIVSTSILNSAYGVYANVAGSLDARIDNNYITAYSGETSILGNAYGIYLRNDGLKFIDLPFILTDYQITQLVKEILRDKIQEYVVNTVFDVNRYFSDEKFKLNTTVENNSINVVSNFGSGYGIYCEGEDNLNANIYDNDMSYKANYGGGIYGAGESYGIRLVTEDPLLERGDIFTSIQKNNIYLYTTSGNATGISCSSDKDLTSVIGGAEDSANYLAVRSENASGYGIRLGGISNFYSIIKNNRMLGEVQGRDGAYGIFLYGNNIGRLNTDTYVPVDISDNKMVLTSTDGPAGGITCTTFLDGDHSLFANIKNNEMNVRGGVNGYDTSWGISLYSSDILGSVEVPLVLENNTMKVMSQNDKAYGIYAIGKSIFANNINNNMSEGITGETEAYGIRMDGDNITANLTDMPMVVRANTGTAGGVFLNANNELTASIKNTYEYDPMIVSSETGDAFGIYLKSGETLVSEVGADGPSIKLTTSSIGGSAYGISAESETSLVFKAVNYDMSGGIFGGKNSVGFKLVSGDLLNADIAENPIVVRSGSDEAAGILLVAKSILGSYEDNSQITTESLNSESYRIIDAKIVQNISELNTEIQNGTTDWIYLKAGDYPGDVSTIDRSLSLWGEGHKMFGVGSGARPNFSSSISITAPNVRIMGLNILSNDKGISVTTEGPFSLIDNTIGVENDSGKLMGIYYSGPNCGTEETPSLIAGNAISVENGSGYAYGIYMQSDDDIYCRILGNETIDVTGSAIYGIYLISKDDIDTVVKDNTVNVEGSLVENEEGEMEIGGNAYGVYLSPGYAESYTWKWTPGNTLNADISNNDLTVSGANTIGIGLGSTMFDYYNIYDAEIGYTEFVGTKEMPLIISGNSIKLSSSNIAIGINSYPADAIYAGITGNNIEAISSAGWVSGISIYAGLLPWNFTGVETEINSIGNFGTPVDISNNYIKAVNGGGRYQNGMYGDAYGIVLSSGNNIFTSIENNEIYVDSFAFACGAMIVCGNDWTGQMVGGIGKRGDTPTYFTGNTATYTGPIASY